MSSPDRNEWWIDALDRLHTLAERDEWQTHYRVMERVGDTRKETITSLATVLQQPFFEFFRRCRDECVREIRNALCNGDQSLLEALRQIEGLTKIVDAQEIPESSGDLNAAAVTEVAADTAQAGAHYVHEKALKRSRYGTMKRIWTSITDALGRAASKIGSVVRDGLNWMGLMRSVNPATQKSYKRGYKRESKETPRAHDTCMTVEMIRMPPNPNTIGFIALQTFNNIDEATGEQSINAERSPYVYKRLAQEKDKKRLGRFIIRLPITVADLDASAPEVFLPRPMEHGSRVNHSRYSWAALDQCWVEAEDEVLLHEDDVTALRLLQKDTLGNLTLALPRKFLNRKTISVCCAFQPVDEPVLTDYTPIDAPMIPTGTPDARPSHTPAEALEFAETLRSTRGESNEDCTMETILQRLAAKIGNEWLTYDRNDVRPSTNDPPGLTHADCVLRRGRASCEGAMAATARLFSHAFADDSQAGYAFMTGFSLSPEKIREGKFSVTGEQAHALLWCRINQATPLEAEEDVTSFLVDATPWDASVHQLVAQDEELRKSMSREWEIARDGVRKSLWIPSNGDLEIAHRLALIQVRLERIWDLHRIGDFPDSWFPEKWRAMESENPGWKSEPFRANDLIETDSIVVNHVHELVGYQGDSGSLTKFLVNRFAEKHSISHACKSFAVQSATPLTSSHLDGRFDCTFPRIPLDTDSLDIRNSFLQWHPFTHQLSRRQRRNICRILAEAYEEGQKMTMQNIVTAEHAVAMLENLTEESRTKLHDMLHAKLAECVGEEKTFNEWLQQAPWLTLLPLPPALGALARKKEGSLPGSLEFSGKLARDMLAWMERQQEILDVINEALTTLPEATTEAKVVPWAAMQFVSQAMRELPEAAGPGIPDVSAEMIYKHLRDAVAAQMKLAHPPKKLQGSSGMFI